ncbi:MAG: hypothetical protein WBP85_02600 [Terracidiphilus sp.]
MSRYILIRRLRGPAFLLLVGVNALLAQRGILGWGQSWPFYLILAGLLMLVERAALASEGYPPYPGMGQGAAQGTNLGANQANYTGASSEAPAEDSGLRVTPTSTTPVPSPWQELEKNKEGGQS